MPATARPRPSAIEPDADGQQARWRRSAAACPTAAWLRARRFSLIICAQSARLRPIAQAEEAEGADEDDRVGQPQAGFDEQRSGDVGQHLRPEDVRPRLAERLGGADEVALDHAERRAPRDAGDAGDHGERHEQDDHPRLRPSVVMATSSSSRPGKASMTSTRSHQDVVETTAVVGGDEADRRRRRRGRSSSRRRRGRGSSGHRAGTATTRPDRGRPCRTGARRRCGCSACRRTRSAPCGATHGPMMAMPTTIGDERQPDARAPQPERGAEDARGVAGGLVSMTSTSGSVTEIAASLMTSSSQSSSSGAG